MKIYKLVFMGIFLLFFTPIIFAEDIKEEIPIDEAMNVFCGTWYLEPGPYAPEEKIVFNLDGTYGFYYPKIKSPTYSGGFKIDKAWKDNKGNIWTIYSMPRRSGIWYLVKISNNGTVREGITLLNLDDIPTKIGPNDYRYAKANKKKPE